MRPLVEMVLGFGLVVGAGSGGAPPAHAFESTAGPPDNSFRLQAAGVLLVDLGLTAVDLRYALRESPLPPAYGAVELLLTAPQVYLLTSWALEPLGWGGKVDLWALALAVWPAALAGHGTWTLFRERAAEPPSEQARRPRRAAPWAAVSPGVLAAGGLHPRPVASMVIRGRF